MTNEQRTPPSKIEVEASIYDHRTFREDLFWQQIPA